MKGLRSLLAFAETAKRGGFAAAGRALGCTPSTVAKSVGRLEIPLGLGIAQVPDYMAQDELAAGRLVELLPRHRPPPMPIHAVMPGNRMVSARVRVLLDALDAYAAAGQ